MIMPSEEERTHAPLLFHNHPFFKLLKVFLRHVGERCQLLPEVTFPLVKGFVLGVDLVLGLLESLGCSCLVSLWLQNVELFVKGLEVIIINRGGQCSPHQGYQDDKSPWALIWSS